MSAEKMNSSLLFGIIAVFVALHRTYALTINQSIPLNSPIVDYDASSTKIQVNVLRISSGLDIDYGVFTALDRVQANKTLTDVFDIVLHRTLAQRVLSKGVGPVLRILLESVTASNQTFAFLIGPDFTADTLAVAQITPLYNLVSISGSVTSNVFSDKSSFPLFFRGGAKSADYVRGFSELVSSLGLQEMSMLTFNEPYLVDGIRALEQEISSLGVKLQYSGVFDFSNRQEVLKSVLKTKPLYIAVTMFGLYEPAFICDLYHSGLMPPDAMYIAVGTFGINNWWIPTLSETATGSTFNCTKADMTRALNGSLLLNIFYDDTSDAEESDKMKMGGANGWRLNERLLYYASQLKAGIPPAVVYSTYDVVMSAFDALYRTEKVMRTSNITLNDALSSHCQSAHYRQYSSIFEKALLATKFYGLTGDFAYDKNQDRLVDLRIYQFQPDNETSFGIRNVGNSSGRLNKTTVCTENLRFATPDGTAPHLWFNAQAVQAFTKARDRNVLVVVISLLVGLTILVAAAVYLYRRYKLSQSDSSWILPAETITTQRKKNRFKRSLASIAASSSSSSLQSMSIDLIKSVQTMSINNAHPSLISAGGKGNSALGRLTVGTMVQPVWLRKFPASRARHGGGGGATTAVNLNKQFPQAKLLHKLTQSNINRFLGMSFSTDASSKQTETDGLLVFEFASKGSLRDLLRTETFALDDELKCSFLYDIAVAVQFVHSQPTTFVGGGIGFLHCNNIVLDKKFTAKLTDYDFCSTRPDSDFAGVALISRMSDSALEQAVTRAPEFVVNGIHTHKIAGEQASVARGDIYSFGMIVVEVTTRALPYCSKTNMDEREQLEHAVKHVVQLYEAKAHGRKPPPAFPLLSVSTKVDNNVPLRQLVAQCANIDPFARPSVSGVLKAIRHFPDYSAGGVVENLIDRLHSYASNLEGVVAERTAALAEEMALSERLLLQILPPSVARKLKSGQAVDPETYEEVSIYFSDIVGFTAISAESTPMQVVILLNSLYTMFDSVLENFDVYKVETIGDAYMVASGVPIRNDSKHLAEVANMALKLLHEIQLFEVPHSKNQRLLLRIGLNVGPCVAGVVGSKMPRYCLFGDTVNTASRMETTGEASKIHLSNSFKLRLEVVYNNVYTFLDRGFVEVKGKGNMQTFWLVK